MDNTFSSDTTRSFVQVERLANPLVMEVFVEKREHDAYNAFPPIKDWEHFTDDIENFLMTVAGRPQDYASAVRTVLVGTRASPGDLIKVFPGRAPGVTAAIANDPSNPMSANVGWLTQVLAPNNTGYGGRKIRGDDTVDKGLGVVFGTALGGPVTGPGLTTDNVPNTNPAPLSTFPYFPGPNQ
jgi:hypothetical protein